LRASSLLLATALLLPASQVLAQADPSAVIAAERAFAADGLAMGIKRSFLKHAAPEAIVFAPDPVKVIDVYGARPDRQTPPLVWWPLWAGIARSGDLGFTTGPSTFGGKENGWYFTVWKRQASGEWKWVYDGGSRSAHGSAAPQGSEPMRLAMATGPARSPAEAMDEVRRAEADLASRALEDTQGAYLAVLAPDAWVTGSKAAPATTTAAVARELATRAPSIRFTPLGGGASEVGDLVWTYGEAAWSAEERPARGHYVRIWQSRAEGWRLVFDQILPVAEPGS